MGLLTSQSVVSSYMLRTPWSVQRDIASAYKLNASNSDPLRAAPSLLGLAILHCCGFGVERDLDATLRYAQLAAHLGSPEIHGVLLQYQALLRTEQVTIIDPMEKLTPHQQRYLADLATATQTKPYRTPLDMVARSGTWMFWDSFPEPITLHGRALAGDIRGARWLLHRGHRDSRDEHGQTALQLACRGGCLPIVKELLDWWADATLADNRGFTALHYLGFFKNDDIPTVARLLLASSHRVDTEARIEMGREERCPDFWAFFAGTPLYCAVVTGNRTAVQVLLAQGANPCSAIEVAASLLLDDIVQMLLDAPSFHQVKPSTLNVFFNITMAHPFRRILMHGVGLKQAMKRTILKLYQHYDFLELMEDDAHPLAAWYKGKTPLQWIILQNHCDQDVDIVEILLSLAKGPIERPETSLVVEAIIGCRYSPLRANTRMVSLVLEQGCSLEKAIIRNGYEFYPFHLAVSSGCISLVEAFLAIKPDLLHSRTSGGHTPLHDAVLQSPEMVRRLLELGADTMATDRLGKTPLAYYIEKGLMFSHGEILPIMLELSRQHNFAVVKSPRERRNALQWATYISAHKDRSGLASHEALRAILGTEGVSHTIDEPGSDGVTALGSACYCLGYSAARILLDAGADPCVLIKDTMFNGPPISCFEAVMRRVQKRAFDFLTPQNKKSRQRSVYNLLLLLAERVKDTAIDEKCSALHVAAMIGFVEEVERLVAENPALIVAKNKHGLTPLKDLFCRIAMCKHYVGDVDPEYKARTAECLRLLYECDVKMQGIYLGSNDQGDRYELECSGAPEDLAVARSGKIFVIPSSRTHLTLSIRRRESAQSRAGVLGYRTRASANG